MKPTNDTTPSTTTPLTSTWIAVLDSRKGRLFEARRLAHGRLHFDERASLHEQWDEKQHHRPDMLSAQGRSVAAFQHENEERIRRFGSQVAAWLEGEARARALPGMIVFCGHSLFGPLRKALPPQLLERIELHAEDLARLTPGELALHSAVVAVTS